MCSVSMIFLLFCRSKQLPTSSNLKTSHFETQPSETFFFFAKMREPEVANLEKRHEIDMKISFMQAFLSSSEPLEMSTGINRSKRVFSSRPPEIFVNEYC